MKTPAERTPPRQNKPSPLLDAAFIGFLAGIVIYSLLANTWGFLTLIPLYLIYRMLKTKSEGRSKK